MKEVTFIDLDYGRLLIDIEASELRRVSPQISIIIINYNNNFILQSVKPPHWCSESLYTYIYIIREEASIFAPQRLRFSMAPGIAVCTVGKVRASTVFMCVCSMFRPSDFLLFVKNGFVLGMRCQGKREPPADGATTPLSQCHSWLGSP